MTTTKDRLLDAGLRLMARRGFADVSVGEVEGEAGFVARGGTFYKHFRSKGELLTAAMQRHISSLDDLDGLAELLPLPDRRSELHVLGRWILARMTAEEEISMVIEKEGERLEGLVDAMREGVSEPGYHLLAAYLRDAELNDAWNADALAVLLLGGLVNLRRSTWTFGQPPMGAADDQVVETWANLCLTVLENPPAN